MKLVLKLWTLPMKVGSMGIPWVEFKIFKC